MFGGVWNEKGQEILIIEGAKIMIDKRSAFGLILLHRGDWSTAFHYKIASHIIYMASCQIY